MSDQRISALNPLPQASLQADADVLAIVDTSGSETKKITAKELFQGAAQQADPNSIPIGILDTSAGIPGDDVNFTQSDVVLGRDGSGAGQGLEIRCTSAGRSVIGAATAADQRTALGLGNLAIANGAWVDGSSFSGTSSGTNTGDQTINLLGAVVGTGTTDILTTFGTASITSDAFDLGAVDTNALGAASVTAAKLADNSSAVVSPGAASGTGAFIGQTHFNSSDNSTYYWDGTTWAQTAGFTGLLVDDNTPLSWSVTFPVDANTPQLNVSLELQPPNTVWAGPEAGTASGLPGFRALVGADLPAPLGTAKGGVYQGEGVAIQADGSLAVAAATVNTLGGVKVLDANLLVTPAGELQHTSSLQAAGTYTKVTTDARGHIVAASALEPADIPALDTSKITTGTLAPSLFATKSITREALADYSIAYIQEENPGLVSDHNGVLWLQESSGQLRMWNGNSWFPVGFGHLAQENLRWGGTIDASSDQIGTVTELGASAGLTVGNSLPAATNGLSGVYVVVSTAGSAISVTPGTTYDPGDWVLCVSQAQGWVRIDTLTSGGGGGGTLDGLSDVTITAPTTGQALTYNGTLGRWQNTALPSAPVSSVFGRTGAVVAAEGDYSLTQMSDVDTTTVAPADGDVLRYSTLSGRWAPSTAASGGGGFPSGTVMLFAQTSAPSGWTKLTTHNDKALRVVSGNAGTGGNISFTSAFASRTPTGSVNGTNSGGAVGNHTLTVAQMPAHSHGVNDPGHTHSYVGRFSSDSVSSGARIVTDTGNETRTTGSAKTGISLANAGSGQAHNHPFTQPTWSGTFTGTALDFAVQYVDVIMASKD